MQASFVPTSPRRETSTFSAAERASLGTRFKLGSSLTNEQREFLAEYGFLVFAGAASKSEVDMILGEVDRIEKEWLAEGRDSVYGIPLFSGKPGGVRMIQRFPFTSVFSEKIHRFVRDDRFFPIRGLIGNDTRVGDREKDGVVVNRNLNMPGSAYPRLGWHTDGLRDLFYLRMPKQMLNVGLHLDHCPKEKGGLRVIPRSHTQGFWSMCFRKPYFVSHGPDPDEFAIETEPGDLTVHDGRMWHRVERCPIVGPESLRRTMYVPYLTDQYQPKSESSRTPLYHHLGAAMRKIKARASS